MRSELGLKEGQKYAGVTRIIRVLNELSVRSWQLFLLLETTEDWAAVAWASVAWCFSCVLSVKERGMPDR